MHPKFLTNLYRIQNDRKSAICLYFVFWLRNLCGVGGNTSFVIIPYLTVFKINYLFHAESARNTLA